MSSVTESKDTEWDDVESVHTVLVVVHVHRLVRVQDDGTVGQLTVLSWSCDRGCKIYSIQYS